MIILEREIEKRGNRNMGCWKENKKSKDYKEIIEKKWWKLRRNAKMKAENTYQESKGKKIVRKER